MPFVRLIHRSISPVRVRGDVSRVLSSGGLVSRRGRTKGDSQCCRKMGCCLFGFASHDGVLRPLKSIEPTDLVSVQALNDLDRSIFGWGDLRGPPSQRAHAVYHINQARCRGKKGTLAVPQCAQQELCVVCDSISMSHCGVLHPLSGIAAAVDTGGPV